MNSRSITHRKFALYATLLCSLILLFSNRTSFGHGAVENSRILQVRLAGPSGRTPVTWNETYYTWNQNSSNFPDYAAPGFSYSTHVPGGTISSAGINDGVHSGLNFSGLNLPSPNWSMTDVVAGSLFDVKWLATAPHDPSHFDIFLTNPGFDAGTQSMGWSDLEFMGRWSLTDTAHRVTIGTGVNPIDGSPLTTYNWTIPIPSNLLGHAALVVVWQREDPAGEAFFSTVDLNVRAVPEPSILAFLGIGLFLACLATRRHTERSRSRIKSSSFHI